MKPYDHKEIEKKWQDRWATDNLYKTEGEVGQKKKYVLDMFPYPSGEGLHVGHPKGYIATDVYSRFQRMKGYAVLHPMGWDAFGLPAENYAIKTKTHPRIAVEKNIARYKSQLSKIGFNYDWSREINTTDPEYYKWTQWIFLKLFEKGLAYQSFEPINWCPSCQTGLANEDLEGGVCERCGSAVEQKAMRQWVLKIREYADRLLDDLETLDKWPEHIKEMQRHWIGKSEGAEIEFKIKDQEQAIKVFTTRPDTLYGATYLVLSPEHTLLDTLRESIQNQKEVNTYREQAKSKSEIERVAEGKEKTGVLLEGVLAVHPATQEEIPIYIADYVLAHYGTGAIMAVPAHDERDFAFAKKFNLPVKPVILPDGFVDFDLFIESQEKIEAFAQKHIEKHGPYLGNGKTINSDTFSLLESSDAKKKITAFVSGKITNTYRLQDWVFSRQRYWGEPIPIIHCDTCGAVPVPEKDLPVRLPEVEHYEPTGTGESPLAGIAEWVNVTCPHCGGGGKRETNTMPQWAGSCWYYLRYVDPHNNEKIFDPKREKYWNPVDVYVGGAEHATRHLIYARFWHKFLYDINVVSSAEPFTELHSVGLIEAEDGRKMSKRWGNVINPDDIVENVGADSLRAYEMFMGPFENAIAWSTNGLVGTRRFIEKVWRMQTLVTDAPVEALETILHQTLKKVGDDIESFKFNTAMSQMMIFLNAVEKEGTIGREQFEAFVKILAPFTPHIAEELWENLSYTQSVHLEEWPKHDESKVVLDEVEIAVQIDGKTRGTVLVSPTAPEDEVITIVSNNEKLKKYLETLPKKVIYRAGKIISFVL
ncbi:leucine--tRNA ligase [Candidatus Kaiserbacteria bacterium CG10_big_fil_rev_8_21_14_0_10_45_20]|uniref:Leucine--tRNA ligase n=1 Tax=Candidatus Kaiserbacteria bacterium CG10_big_fil_rev_8_21_14_0_10_45_20 TaxID=1974607 RepID=A0A2H0UGK0_9BACT|nr:MAG: leucine--tRNA ligase [Candidatus Kaiserbacteria bacterium CG10_big_fil_rev_8_21_14_0_10_45_20]